MRTITAKVGISVKGEVSKLNIVNIVVLKNKTATHVAWVARWCNG